MDALLRQIADTSRRLAEYIELNGDDCLSLIVHGQADLINKRAVAYMGETSQKKIQEEIVGVSVGQ